MQRSVVMSSGFFGFIIDDVTHFHMAGYEDLSKKECKMHQLEDLKIDMNRFKSIWGLVLGI